MTPGPSKDRDRAARSWRGAAALLLLAARAAMGGPDVDTAPDAAERRSVQAVCGRCHSLQLVLDTPMSLEEWRDTVQKMVDRGAQGTDEQFDDILSFLHRTVTTINVNTADADELSLVLNVDAAVARSIVARRTARPFATLADLATVPGMERALESKSRLVFFH